MVARSRSNRKGLMPSHRSTGFHDDPPPSSVQRRGQHALDQICHILEHRFEIPRHAVRTESRFIEDLGIDAFDLPDLILALEETFEVDIPTTWAARVLTVKDALGCVLPRA